MELDRLGGAHESRSWNRIHGCPAPLPCVTCGLRGLGKNCILPGPCCVCSMMIMGLPSLPARLPKPFPHEHTGRAEVDLGFLGNKAERSTWASV